MNRDDLIYVATLFMLGVAFSSPREREVRGKACFKLIDTQTFLSVIGASAERWTSTR